MLIAASYFTAHSDSLGEKSDQIENIRNSAKHCSFFQRWDAIHEELRRLYETAYEYDTYIPHLTKMSDEVVSIFETYGFEISGEEGNLHVKLSPGGKTQ